MDRVQSFARVIVGAMAIYFSVNVLVMMLTPVGMMLNLDSAKEAWLLVVNSATCLLCLVLLQYFGVFRPQRVVGLITSHIEPEQPMAPGQWLPAAYRLVCVFAGLYCIYGVLYRAITQISLYYLDYTRSQGLQTTSRFIRPDEIAATLVLLVLGVYLLAGAPHFVRWHLQRTIRLCAENRGD